MPGPARRTGSPRPRRWRSFGTVTAGYTQPSATDEPTRRLARPPKIASSLEERDMGLYSRYVLPRLTHLSMGYAELRPYRARVVGAAKGRVLEIGIGTGLNLPFYGDAVEEVIGV